MHTHFQTILSKAQLRCFKRIYGQKLNEDMQRSCGCQFYKTIHQRQGNTHKKHPQENFPVFPNKGESTGSLFMCIIQCVDQNPLYTKQNWRKFSLPFLLAKNKELSYFFLPNKNYQSKREISTKIGRGQKSGSSLLISFCIFSRKNSAT